MGETKLVLASRSKSRVRLLREAGYRFEQIVPEFNDPAQPDIHCGISAADLSLQLALKKAQSLLDSYCGVDGQVLIVLGSDTVCVNADGQLIGQPATASEANVMIRGFVNQSHEVVTAVALLVSETGRSESTKTVTIVDTATVEFGDLDPKQIDEYVASGQWKGRAGGYNLFDRRQAGWPVVVAKDSDPTTVVGLPMKQLAEALLEMGIKPKGSSDKNVDDRPNVDLELRH